MSRSARSPVPLVFALVVMGGAAGGSSLAGCSSDRAEPTRGRSVAAQPSVLDSASVGVAAAGPGGASTDDRPLVQVMADGSLELRPRITDVSMLERQPDGSYRRRCGRPSAETRAMMEQARRARRGSE